MLYYIPLPLRKYAHFNGRTSRSQFVRWLAFLCLAYYIFFAIDLWIIAPALGYLPFEDVRERYVTTIGSLLLAIPWLATSVRRLHDLDRTGWWMLLAIPAGAVIYFTSPIGLAIYSFLTDRSRSGWIPQNVTDFAILNIYWIVIALAMLCFSPVIVWYFKKGSKTANRFGPSS